MRAADFIFIAAIAAALGISFGVGGVTSLANSVSAFCAGISGILPIAAVLAVFASAVIYIIGQFTGAETRARAVVWATTLFIGALIAILVQVVTPTILSGIYGTQISCSATNSSNSSGGLVCSGGSFPCPALSPAKCCNPGYWCQANGQCCTSGSSPTCY